MSNPLAKKGYALIETNLCTDKETIVAIYKEYQHAINAAVMMHKASFRQIESYSKGTRYASHASNLIIEEVDCYD